MTAILYRLIMAYPAAIAEKANAAAAILDPDTGGAETFTAAYTETVGDVLYYCADVPIFQFDEDKAALFHVPDFGAVMRSKDPAVWWMALTGLAQERGRELTLTEADVAELCAAVLFDDEIVPDGI
jgi:hypothetical protein